jgi:hypothetical protein
LLSRGNVVLAKFEKRKLQVILIVIWIAGDGVAEDLLGAGGFTQMRINISQ